MNRTMKRFISALLSITLMLGTVTGCSGSDSSDPKQESSDASSEQTTSSEDKQDTSKTDSSPDGDSGNTYHREPIELDDLTRPDNGEYAPQEVVWSEAQASGLFSAASGVYESEFELTLSGDGEIYYTTDGSDPALSDTAVKYVSPIKITDRKGDKNVVSAVDPLLIDAAHNNVNASKDGFVSTVSAPSDDAVDKCTVVRAAVKNADGSFGETQTETFFVGSMYEHIAGIGESSHAQNHSLAVISISVDYDDFFDSEKGIYVKGDIFDSALESFLQSNRPSSGEDARSLDANYKQRGKAWERPAAINFFESDGAVTRCVLSQQCGIRIQGNYSRSDLQKGLRLFARSDYGDNNFRYEVFEGLTDDSGEIIDKFKSLTLRAGGNCAFTTKYSDTYWQSLVTNLDCDMKTSRPCVVYLNGEYWGLYVLEEDYQSDYFEDHHGVEKDDVVLYKGDAETYSIGYKLDLGDLPEGERDVSYYFRDLYIFFDTHYTLETQADFEELAQLVDVDSVMDYFAMQIWINNKWDWPGKNWSMWKTVNTDASNEYADGRWRLVFYDVEFGGVSGKGDATVNTIKEDNYKTYGLLDTNTKNPAVLCFAYLMTNEGWREEFYATLRGLSEGAFEYDRAKGQLDWFKDCYSPLYDQFFERYGGTGSANDSNYGGYASYQCIADFLSKRSDNIEKMISWCDKTLERMY